MGMKPKRDPKLDTPKTLKLPDGREVPVKDLVKRISNRANHNLRTRRKTTIPDLAQRRAVTPSKYTVEERVWQSTATIDDIVKRYGYTPKRALGLVYTARYIVDRLGLDTDNTE